ncbi:MAG: dTDP-4-dehydrorhamnose 3,5-epimerase family protein, partial [Bacteroidales bacterium]|nr:dTDP-4-dehydrorhamnose 3,5-epimerase family protein [Bacteroidales bacterium]
YIPPGYAHGFLTLRDDTHFLYKCTNDYSPAHEGGYRWNDPGFGILWPLDKYGITEDMVQVSEKDKILPGIL